MITKVRFTIRDCIWTCIVLALCAGWGSRASNLIGSGLTVTAPVHFVGATTSDEELHRLITARFNAAKAAAEARYSSIRNSKSGTWSPKDTCDVILAYSHAASDLASADDRVKHCGIAFEMVQFIENNLREKYDNDVVPQSVYEFAKYARYDVEITLLLARKTSGPQEL